MNLLDTDIFQRTKEYNEYIKNHKQNVVKAWKEVQEKYPNLFLVADPIEHNIMQSIVNHHDDSKYSSEEFMQYRNRFYPCKGEAIDEEAFQEAWKHHYSNNPHHPEYWNSDGVVEAPLRLKQRYCLEMILDWMAMSYTQGDTAARWYADNKHNMNILPECIDFVENILNVVGN